MYHKIEEQEKHPEKFVLAEISEESLEDEVFDLISKPRQTQKTVGFYLKKVGDSDDNELSEKPEPRKKKFSLQPGNLYLENEVSRNQGFWVEKPQIAAPLVYKLKQKYTVDIPRKNQREQGIFPRPRFLELDHVIKLANAGLLYSDEVESDSEEEIKIDNTACVPLRKFKYEIVNPCKEEKKQKEEEVVGPPKDLIEEMERFGRQPPFGKIPTGCQCDFYGKHNVRPEVWDNPFYDRMDMLRQHEMNKAMKPFKHELLKNNYAKYPPVKFMAHKGGAKRIFPIYQVSNM